jgi:cytochrome c-type biogenesis protein CcmE
VGRIPALEPAREAAAVTLTETPPEGQAGRERRRVPVRLLLVAGVVLAAVAVLAFAGLQGSLVYYKTTSELVAEHGLQGHRVRLGGLVEKGSVHATANGVRFLLTDGVHEVEVVNTGQPRGVFREGEGAVVEGVLGSDGVFRSDLLLVKHSNVYEPPASGTGRPQQDSG